MQGSQENQTPDQDQSFYNAPNEAQFTAPPDDDPPKSNPQKTSSLSWEASEYVHNSKGALWLVVMILVFLAIAGVAFWLQSWTFVILTAVMAVAMGIFAFRPPHTMHYTLSDAGIEIDKKLYRFENYRAFGIIQEGAFLILMLVPTKRFLPALNIYFKQEDGDKIISIIGYHLPLEDMKPDLIDALMRKLHF